MSSEELWEAFSARNPEYNTTTTLSIDAAALQKMFRQTWSIAYDSGYRRGLHEGYVRTKRDADRRPQRGEAFDF